MALLPTTFRPGLAVRINRLAASIDGTGRLHFGAAWLLPMLVFGLAFGSVDSSKLTAAVPQDRSVIVDATRAAAPNNPPKKVPSAIRLQELDEPLEPLDPIRPRTEKDVKRLDALSWYALGRILEARNQLQDALDAYRSAIQLDPNAVEVYRVLIPLAFTLNQTEEAYGYARKAVELDPNDFDLLRRLGMRMAAQQKFAEAIELLEQAVSAKSLKKNAGMRIRILFDLGVIYHTTGESKKAAESFSIVLDALDHPEKYELDARLKAELASRSARAYELMGQAFLDAGESEKAILAFKRAAKAQRTRPGILSFHLAQVYLQTKQYDLALKELEKYFDAQLQSKGRQSYELLAEILKATDRSDDLVPRLESMLTTDEHNSVLQYYLAEQYVDVDRLDDAEKLYRKILDEKKNDSISYAGLVGIYRRQQKAVELLEALAEAVKGREGLSLLGPEIDAISKDRPLLEKLVKAGHDRIATENDNEKLDFPSALVLAKLASMAEMTDAVAEFYGYCLTIRKDRAGTLYEDWAKYLLKIEDYPHAAEVLQKAVDDKRLAPERPNFLFLLSHALELSGQTEKALDAIAEARKTFSDHPRLHYQEAWIYYHSRQWKQAEKLFREVMAKYPGEQELIRRCQFSLSNVYVMQGDIAQGEKVLESVLAEEPDDPSVNNDLGYLYADQGKNLEKAEKMIRKAVKADPDNPAYLDSLGWVLHKLDKNKEALTHLLKALSLPNGSDSTIWDHAGDCHQKLNEHEAARKAWEKALELENKDTFPDQDLIKKINEKLKPK